MTEQTRLQYFTTASWLLGYAEGLDPELHRALINRLTLAAHLLHAVWEEGEMTDLRTAAQQALEAIREADMAGSTPTMVIEARSMCEPTITALRAALAEPCSHGECFGGECIYTPQSQRPAEPVQERNFCQRCGKRTNDIHTCTPPQEEPVAGRAFLERILTAMEGVIDVADRKTDEFDALRSCVIDLTLMLHTAPPTAEPVQEPVYTDLLRLVGNLFAEAYKAGKAAAAEPKQDGCDHCNSPLYAAIKCRVCGRVTSEHLTPGSEHLGSEQMAEPIAWYHVPYPNNGAAPMVSLSKQHEPSMYGAVVPLFLGAPYDQTSLELCEVCGWKTLIPGDCCLNCARINCTSLQDQNTELDRKLAEMEAKLNNPSVDDAFRILAEANRRAIDYINHLEAENAKLRKGPV